MFLENVNCAEIQLGLNIQFFILIGAILMLDVSVLKI